MEIKIPYYQDNTRISNSAIGWFLKGGPQYLRDMLDGKEEGIKGTYLDRGTMIHAYILQPEEFWKEYKVLDFTNPQSKQQQTFAEEYVNNLSIDEEKRLIESYKKAYATKETDAKVLLKAVSLQRNLQGYIEYLEEGKTKKVITWSDLSMLKEIKSNIQNHKLANKLIYGQKDVEEHNEFHINWLWCENFMEQANVKCKSLIDRVIIDHNKKEITLIDLKTTSDVYNFRHSLDEFQYVRQMQFYIYALESYMLEEYSTIGEYTFKVYIIAIQTNKGYPIRVFKISPTELSEQYQTISNALSKISWHIEHNLWDHTREYYEGDGSETI